MKLSRLRYVMVLFCAILGVLVPSVATAAPVPTQALFSPTQLQQLERAAQGNPVALQTAKRLAAEADAGNYSEVANLLKADRSADPFFQRPASVSGQPGTILSQRSVSVGALGSLGVWLNATQYKFVSSDSKLRPDVATATLLVPQGVTEVRHIYALQEPTDSLGVDCSAGPKLARGASLDASVKDMAVSALGRGYAVLLTDHDGVAAEYAAPRQTGYIALDAMRLVAKKYPLAEFISEGYSGGGITDYGASMLQDKYAEELNGKVKAYISGGTPVNLEKVVNTMNGTRIGAGIVFAAVLGVMREYPELYSLLNPAGIAAGYLARNACLDAFGIYGFLQVRLETYAVPGAFESALAKSMYRDTFLSNGSRSVPADLIVYHSPEDQWIPFNQARAWYDEQYTYNPGGFKRQFITGAGTHSLYGENSREMVKGLLASYWPAS